jgi:hypothetical protein
MFAPGIAITNARRAELGLPAIERLGAIHDACAYAIVALPMAWVPQLMGDLVHDCGCWCWSAG